MFDLSLLTSNADALLAVRRLAPEVQLALIGEAADVLARLAAHEAQAMLVATHLRREAELADVLRVIDAGRLGPVVRRGEPEFGRVLGTLRPG